MGPGQTQETVAPELEAIAARLEQAYPAENEDRTFGSAPQSRISVSYTIVGGDYFRSLGLSMLRGREFTDAETQGDTPPAVAIVDETLARALWPDGDALGQQIRFRDRSTGSVSDPLSVVGLAPGRRNEIFDQQPTPHVYVPFGWQ